MKIASYLLFFSLFLTCLSFTCSDLQENQCQTLQADGCSWSDNTCSGTYSPSCIPPSCYYIDPSSASTATATGAPDTPLKTLSEGLTKLSGKDGTLIIVNRMKDMLVNTTARATISSNITIQPLFADARYKIDVSNVPSSAGYVFTVNRILKIIGGSLTANFTTITVLFKVLSGEVYLEDLEIIEIPSTKTFIVNQLGSSSIFSMKDCRITNAYTIFQIYSGKTFWKNLYVNGTKLPSIDLNQNSITTMNDCFFTGTSTQLLIRSTNAQVSLKNCTFRELTATYVIYASSPVGMSIKNCIFDQIVSTNPQALLYFYTSGNKPFTAVIDNSSFTNIQAQTSVIALKGPFASLSLFNITMTNVIQIGYRFTKVLTKALTLWSQGVCVAAIENAEIVVKSSNFSNIESHCFWLEDTDLNMTHSIFDNEKLDVDETSILREDRSSLTEISGASWIRLKTTTSYEQQVSQSLIANNKFIQNKLRPKYGGAIRITGVFASEVQVSGNEFIGNTAYYGGAISSDNAFASLKLSDNIFSGNSAYNGGAIYKISANFDEKLSEASLSTDGDQFLGNLAVKNGGAMYLNWESIDLSETEFVSNQATNGGAIYFINLGISGKFGLFPDSSIDEVYQKKYGRGMNNVRFLENSASNIGGSMKLFFEYARLKNEDKGVVFEDNVDPDSGQKGVSQGRPAYYALSFYDITSQTQPKITDDLQYWIDNSDLTKLAFTMNSSETTDKFPEIQQKSGNDLAQIMKVQVYDNENKIANYINGEEVRFEIASYENNRSNYSASLVYSPIGFIFSKGQFLAKGTLKMHGEPKTTAVLRFKNFADNSDFIQDSGMPGSFDLQVQFIDCEIGDVFETQTRSCSVCAEGTFSIKDPYKATYCHECPENIECFGSSKVGPKAGYWLYSLDAITAIKCPYSAACLGNLDKTAYAVQGECSYPHQGNLCNQCAPKYAKFGSSTECQDCEKNVMYYVKLILFFSIQATIVLCIHKLNCGKEDKQCERKIFYLNLIKIVVSFIQINSVIISYDMNWSVLSKDAADILNKVIPSIKDSFPIDCFLALSMSDNENINFVRLVVTFFQPFILWGLCILIYFLVLLHSKQRPKIAYRKIFLICAFLVQPNMILTALELFKCQNISSPESRELFLTSNSDLKCWTRSHMIWGYGFGLPMFLIWGAILPFILFIKTTKYWTATCSSWKPFYYQGIRKESFYWEFMILIFKTLVIVVFTVFTSTSAEIQILLTLLICLSFIVLFIRLHPYQDPRLHLSSLISLLALTFMSYVGFFFLSNTWTEARMIVTSLILIFVNFAVFLYPFFSILKDRKKANTLKQSKLFNEIKPQITAPTETGRIFSLKDADESVVHNISNHEIKIGNTQKEGSIDNFTIMQRSGSRLLSLNRTDSPPSSSEEKIFPRGDFLTSSSPRHKKVYMKRLHLKVREAVKTKPENKERTPRDNVKTETTTSASSPIIKPQRENESGGLLLNILKLTPLASSSNE